MAAQPSLPHAVSGATLAHLEQLIDGFTAGAILIDTAGAILWANAAARAMHGMEHTEQLGATADDYCQRFCLRLRGGRRLQAREYPIMKLLAGESFDDMVVEVMRKGDEEPR